MTEKTREEIKALIWQALEQWEQQATVNQIIKIEIVNSTNDTIYINEPHKYIRKEKSRSDCPQN